MVVHPAIEPSSRTQSASPVRAVAVSRVTPRHCALLSLQWLPGRCPWGTEPSHPSSPWQFSRETLYFSPPSPPTSFASRGLCSRVRSAERGHSSRRRAARRPPVGTGRGSRGATAEHRVRGGRTAAPSAWGEGRAPHLRRDRAGSTCVRARARSHRERRHSTAGARGPGLESPVLVHLAAEPCD